MVSDVENSRLYTNIILNSVDIYLDSRLISKCCMLLVDVFKIALNA